MRERRRITIQGIVQGVGFRPFVYGLARHYGLGGYVANDASGVTIEVEGRADALAAFGESLCREPPPLAVIDRVTWECVSPHGESCFVIAESGTGGAGRAQVGPDVAVCDACLRELADRSDRRFRYPFINCTNCGPRFTIVRDIPYDRARTTMARFAMCPDCQREYDDPGDRRFHAQPNACPRCGPQLRLIQAGAGAEATPAGEAALLAARRLLAAGAIVAVKGLGGYHLACDARDEAAVSRLRARKVREDKPFALMLRDLATVDACCTLGEEDRALLLSRERPIVLLPRLATAGIAQAVAPGHGELGVLLPYTPLHHLLFAPLDACPVPDALVLTSGNRSDEPIAYRDEDALARLATIADAFLVHDRPIQTRCDDSVVRRAGGGTLFIRRARGYAPRSHRLALAFPQPILAVGAHQKNTFCLGRGHEVVVSHHIGDLENVETLLAFREGIDHYRTLCDIAPAAVAHDRHPDYLATRWAEEFAAQEGLPAIAVQHHHAHIASVIAEQGLSGPVIGVACDGTGLGDDGTIWGGEFLIADLEDYRRAAHLAHLPLPGGAAAIREPWRVAAAWLWQVYGDAFLDLPLPFVRRLDRARWATLRRALARGVNCPRSSSMGRLFDAVAALLGLRAVATYEGQAAIELEQTADRGHAGAYAFALAPGEPLVGDHAPVLRAIVADLLAGVSPAIVAARFHRGVARLIAEVCVRLRAETGLGGVALSGGVFQNMLLLEQARALLARDGFAVYTNSAFPANDGGIALGQAAVAAARLARDAR